MQSGSGQTKKMANMARQQSKASTHLTLCSTILTLSRTVMETLAKVRRGGGQAIDLLSVVFPP
jgi:hypothetical protein